MTNTDQPSNTTKETKTPPPPRRLVMGSCIYMKSLRLGTKRRDQEIQFKGHAFGIYLGHVPNFHPEPTGDQLFAGMGHIGFVTFDDVEEFVGADVAKEVLAKWTAKYQQSPIAVPDAPIIPKGPILVDIDGKPVGSES